ncbi:hypothetical protein N0V84_012646 [Fusarium piperis]|uniref:MalT-like TPR region domain-containing protein n=1 Tax=Fusarium piperis TaxID=1435070 RepID=A0A9W8TC50_9HYPO|nr:hypothetical protein N0V84_012646 [Fusarium piperis]
MNTVWGLALAALSNEARAVLDILATLDPDGVLEDLLIGDWSEPELDFLHPSKHFDLLALYQTWEPKIEPVFAFATLLLDTANYLWEKGLTKEGMETMQIGEDVCVQLSNIPEVIPIHANICAIAGGVHAEIGFSGRAMARQKCELALDLRKRRVRELEQSGTVASDDSMLLANAWNDVGVVRIQNEEFEEAVPCLQESLRLKNKWESEDKIPWHFGETYKNLSFTHLSRGDFKKAKEFAHRSYNLCSRGMAEKSAATQKAKFILATILLNCGDIEEALMLHKEILIARQEIFGKAHGLTKDSLYNVGEVYRQQGGKLEKAEAKFREALEDCKAWPPEAIARAQYHLALVINEFTDRLTFSRKMEAAQLEEEARQLRERLDPSSVSNTPEANLRLHDFMVSLWAGRTGLVKEI